MSNAWFQYFKDGLFAAQQFFNEKKQGQYPSDVVAIQQFAAIVLGNSVELHIAEQFRTILTNSDCLALMTKGLFLKTGPGAGNPAPGEFFTKPIATITIQFDESVFSLNINGLLKSVSEHARKTDNIEKGKMVNLYIVSSFSQAFVTYVIQVGPSFMQKPMRDAIVGRTISQEIKPPYQQGERASAIKGVINDALGNESVRGFLEKQIGPAATRTLAAGVVNFDGSKIGGLQEGLTKALNQRKFEPIQTAVMELVTSTAGNVQAEDGIDAQDQD